MSIFIYPKGTNLSKLSLNLLWFADWPPCMECGGPLMRMTYDSVDIKRAGKCTLEGNVPRTALRYVYLNAHFNCVCCVEHHEITWYFFYNQLDEGRYQLDSSFYVTMEALRLKRKHINLEIYDLLRSMRIQ